MSLTVALNTAVSGLFAHQRAIASTAENIANVNSVDYVRREATFVTDAIPGQFSGVDVNIARASVDRFLQSARYASSADAAGSAVIADAIERVEASLGTPGSNISFANKVDDAFAAFVTLSADPSSIAAKGATIAAVQEALNAFDRSLGAIDTEIQAADARLTSDVNRANVLLEEIYNLNQIVHDSAGAADQIDTRLRELSSLIDIEVTRDDDGRVQVSTPQGALLANAGGFSALSVTQGPSTGISLASVDASTGATGTPSDITAQFTSGEIPALVSLRNIDLPQIEATILAARDSFLAAINSGYAQSVSFPPPSVLTGSVTGLAAGDATGLTGSTSLAVISDQGALQRQIDIDFDTQTISVDGGAPIAFDGTVGGLASAIDTALAGVGSASFSGGQLTISATSGGLGIADDSAGFGGTFGLNQLVASSGGQVTLSAALLANPANLATAGINLTGASIGSSVAGPNDGSGAARIAEAGASASRDAIDAISLIGAASQAASSARETNAAYDAEIETRVSGDTGVNLDEELSNLILYQQSYNANARVIAAVDELWDALLSIV